MITGVNKITGDEITIRLSMLRLVSDFESLKKLLQFVIQFTVVHFYVFNCKNLSFDLKLECASFDFFCSYFI